MEGYDLFKKYSLKTWKHNKLQILLNVLVISIAIATMFSIQLISTYNTKYAIANARKINGGDLNIKLYQSVLSSTDEAKLMKLKNEGDIEYQKEFKLQATLNFNGIRSIVLVKFINNDAQVSQGIVINKTLSEKLGVKVGDTLSFGILQLSSLKMNYSVSKIISKSDEFDEETFGVVTLPTTTLNNILSDKFVKALYQKKMNIGSLVTNLNISIIKTKEQKNIENKIYEMFGDMGYIRTSEDYTKTYKSTNDIENNSLYVIGVLAFVIGGISIISTFLLLALKRQKDFSILKTFGMKNKVLKDIIRFEALFIGLISDFIGILLGIIASNFILKAGNSDINVFSYGDVLFWTATQTMLLGMFLCIAVSSIPLQFIIRIKPMKILRQQYIEISERIDIGGEILKIALVMGIVLSIYMKSPLGFVYIFLIIVFGAILYVVVNFILLQLSKLKFVRNKILILCFRNLKRQSKIFSIILITMIFGLSFISTVLNMVNNGIPLIMKNVITQDGYNITLEEPYEAYKNADQMLADNKDIMGYTKILAAAGFTKSIDNRNIQTEVNNSNFSASGKNYAKRVFSNTSIKGYQISEGMFRQNISYGRWFKKTDKGSNNIVIGQYFVECFKAGIGSNIEIIINNKAEEFKVIGIRKKDFITSDEDIYMDYGTLNKYFSKSQLSYLNKNVSMQYLIKPNKGSTKALMNDLNRSFPDAQVFDIQPILKVLNDFFKQQINVFIFISILCISASVFLIANITYISFLQRMKEFRLIKIMGGKKRDLRVIIFIELQIIGILGGLISDIISEGINFLIVRIAFNSKYMPNINISFGTFSVGVIISLVVAIIIVPRIKVKSLSEILRAE